MVSERALQEIYEAPFRIAVQQGGLDSVMCSYNQINGLPSCQNPTTLGDLKHGTGFNGFVVPDFGFAVRDPVAAASAGVDLPALPGGGSGGLTAADFTSGQIPAARLTTSTAGSCSRSSTPACSTTRSRQRPRPRSRRPSTSRWRPMWPRRAWSCSRTTSTCCPSRASVRSIALIGPTGNDAVFVTGGSAGVPLAAGQAITPLAGHHRACRVGRRQRQRRTGLGR